MRRTRIDFAAPGVRRTLFRTPPRFIFFVPAVVPLLLSLLTQFDTYREKQAELQALHSAIAARHAAPVAAKPVVAPAPKVILAPAQANAINDAIMQLNLPWRDLAEAVRDATPASVALLALDPDAKHRTLRITAEARTSDDMLAYVTQMQAVDLFSSVVLTRHEVMEQDPNRPLRFQISAQWELR